MPLELYLSLNGYCRTSAVGAFMWELAHLCRDNDERRDHWSRHHMGVVPMTDAEARKLDAAQVSLFGEAKV